jgi:hypothetical protein
MKPIRQSKNSSMHAQMYSGVQAAVPDLPSLATAMSEAEPLVSLMQRLQASKRCLDAVRSVIPPMLHPHISAGPLDDEGWTLLVANTAISSKLRQLQPRLLDALAQNGCKVNALRLRVQMPG